MASLNLRERAWGRVEICSKPERQSKRRSSSWVESLLCARELLDAWSLPPPDPAGLLRHGDCWREKPGRSSSSLNMFGEEQWGSLSRVTAHGKSLSQVAQSPPQPALCTGTAASSPDPLAHAAPCLWPSSACKRQFHFSATDSNSNWVFPFKSGQEQLCQPAVMRAIFEENCQTSQEVKYDIFKPFLNAHVHTCAFPSASKKQLLPTHKRSSGCFNCVAAETASLWQLKEKGKNLQFMCVFLLYVTDCNGKNPIASFLLALSHPRHYLSSRLSMAACMVVFTPLCSLIQVHSLEVIWNIVCPPLCIARGKNVLWWRHQIRTQIQVSYSILVQISGVTQLFTFY